MSEGTFDKATADEVFRQLQLARARAGLPATVNTVPSPVPHGAKTPDQQPGAPQTWHRDQGQPTVARVYVGDKNSLDLTAISQSLSVSKASSLRPSFGSSCASIRSRALRGETS